MAIHDGRSQPGANVVARTLSAATHAIGIADLLTPAQVRVFSDCQMRWFYEHVLGVPDPPTATQALDTAVRAALLTNFRHKLASKEDLQPEGVAGLFRRAWQKERHAAVFTDDEEPERMGRTGEELVCIYMNDVAPQIRPASVEQKTMRGMFASVRIQAEFDVQDDDGTLIAIRTAPHAANSIDPMHRFELTTCCRLAADASGVVRSDTLVHSQPPQCVSQFWKTNESDIQLTDRLYPIAQAAMRRGHYMPNRNSILCSRHQCPHWRRCERDFGGTVEP